MHSFTRAARHSAMAAFTALAASSAALAPEPANAQGMFINPLEERVLGVRGHEQALQRFGGPHPDANFTAYVQDLGVRVARTSARFPDQFVFSFVNSGEVNAFTRMGGFVYISAGIIPWVNDEAEFTALLGHEVGHAVGRHSAHAINRQNVADRLIDLSERAGRPAQVVEDRRLRASLMILEYGREQEFASDDTAFNATQRLGLDTLGPARMFRQLVLCEGVTNTLLNRDNSNYPLALRSHPPGSDRVRRSADLAQQGGGASGPSNRDAFLDRINGLSIPGSVYTGNRATRIRIVTVSEGQTAETLAQRMVAPANIRLQLFLAINGYTDGTSITPGTRVKILAA